MNEGRIAIVVGLVEAVIIGLGVALSRREAAMAKVGIKLTEVETGREIKANSPATLITGYTYQMTVTVQNLSRLDGTPQPATLTTQYLLMVDATSLVPSTTLTEEFAANQTRDYAYPARPELRFTVPAGAAGRTGAAIAAVFDPNGNELARDEEPISILSFIYAAGVGVGLAAV